MVSFRQLMSAEMLDELLPTHEFFRVIDRRVILKSESDLPLPSDRFMVILRRTRSGATSSSTIAPANTRVICGFPRPSRTSQTNAG